MRTNVALMPLMAILLASTPGKITAQSISGVDPAKLIAVAMKYKGVPYIYGAESPRAFDCSGFVRYVYREAYGVELPRSARDFYRAGTSVASGQARTGDVLVFDTVGGAPSHVAIFVGDGSIIHAVSAGPKTGVILSPVNDKYWAPKIISTRRFIARTGVATGDSPPAVASVPSVQPPVPAAKPAASSGVAPMATAMASSATSESVPAPAAGAGSASAIATTAASPAASDSPASVTGSAAVTVEPTPPKTAVATLPPASTPPASAPSAPSATTRPATSTSPAPGTPASTPPAPSAAATRPAADDIPIVDLGFSIPRTKDSVTDRIPTAAGTKIAFTLTNESGADGTFIIVFFRVDPKTYKLQQIHEERVKLAEHAAFSLPPYLFTQEGKYRLIVRDNWGNQKFERAFEVLTLR